MFYQIETADHMIADVVEGENWVCIFNDRLVRCDASLADGIIGSDCNTIYHLAGRPECGSGNFYVTQISEEVYEDLYERLELGEDIEIEEPVDTSPEITPVDDDPADPVRIPTRAELADRIAALEEELAAAKILLGVDE